MRDLGRVIAHIPARGGSQRVPLKNLRLIAGKPLLFYTIEAAKKSVSLDELYINTDSEKIAAYAKENGISVYLRSPELASNLATSDQFNIDFIRAKKPDTLVMINPVCPLIETADIDAALLAFRNCDADTLITSTSTQMQCFLDDEPINIRVDEQLAPSQSNKPVHVCNWAITVWDAVKFQQRYETLGFAVLGETRKLLPIDPIKAVKISTEEDFRLAEAIMQARKTVRDDAPASYWNEE